MRNLQVSRRILDRADILRVLQAFARGDFTVRLPSDLDGEEREIAEAFNAVAAMAQKLTGELARVRRQVGEEGKSSERIAFSGEGGWRACIEAVNGLLEDTLRPTSEMAFIMEALARGDFQQAADLPPGAAAPRGEFLRLRNILRSAVDQLNAVASEVSRVAHEVGVEGKLGSQARVRGLGGAWKDLVENVNVMAANLTGQVRNIAEVEQQAESLRQSQALLKKRQEDLQRVNKQLQQQAKQLSEQMRQVEFKNKEVEQAKAVLEEKAEQLSLSSRYKSEFLANMSHELRTPLNSLLILAQLLTENPSRNLTPKQIEYAQTIYTAGNDLLSLINDILDLAKVESGTVTLSITSERFADLQEYVERTFRQIAQDKGLAFSIAADLYLPAAIRTDAKRLQQILKNLLSNAFKFTAKGSVSLEIALATSGWTSRHAVLDAAEEVVAFSVTDTGIGIPRDKQQIIFEAFQQADGTTSRQFGGTGLGLSISSDLAELLGGEIQVESTPGKGTTFTLYLPLDYRGNAGGQANASGVEKVDVKRANRKAPRHHLMADVTAQAPLDKQDDATNMEPQDRVAMIVESDAALAAHLLDAMHESGLKGLIASNGHNALALVREFFPDTVTLDAQLPDMDGWAVLKLLKQDAETMHIPVNVFMAKKHEPEWLCLGSLGTRQKSSAAEALREALACQRRYGKRDPEKLLLAAARPGDWNEALRTACGKRAEIATADSGRRALELLDDAARDCLVVCDDLADMTQVELLRALAQEKDRNELSLVLLRSPQSTGEGAVASAEALVLRTLTSRESFLEQAAAFPAEAARDLPPRTQRLRSTFGKGTPALDGRKVLVVDDDIRNIFTLTSALEQHRMVVLNAENGLDCIETLKNTSDIDIILMDMMMPDVDGYDTIRSIRGVEHLRDVPIIGVSAKAMKGDREKAIAAGASDYVTKPVNVEHLLALMRVWLAY
jgi:signal transduction histidine kinase/CheY-like chemotaxis protein